MYPQGSRNEADREQRRSAQHLGIDQHGVAITESVAEDDDQEHEIEAAGMSSIQHDAHGNREHVKNGREQHATCRKGTPADPRDDGEIVCEIECSQRQKEVLVRFIERGMEVQVDKACKGEKNASPGLMDLGLADGLVSGARAADQPVFKACLFQLMFSSVGWAEESSAMMNNKRR